MGFKDIFNKNSKTRDSFYGLQNDGKDIVYNGPIYKGRDAIDNDNAHMLLKAFLDMNYFLLVANTYVIVVNRDNEYCLMNYKSNLSGNEFIDLIMKFNNENFWTKVIKDFGVCAVSYDAKNF
ncbi:MAG: hypothetical protein FWH29_02915 [Methanobrevibacter sp.]|nr:hypothetical protein [Methanobrevibacter sp.]